MTDYFNPLSWFGQSKVNVQVEVDEKPAYATEFHQLRAELVGDVKVFTEKYPLAVAVYVVVSVIFGFTYLFSISPFNIANGLFHFALGGALGWNVFKNGPWEFIQNVIASGKTVKANMSKPSGQEAAAGQESN